MVVRFVRLWLKAMKALSKMYLFKNKFVYIYKYKMSWVHPSSWGQRSWCTRVSPMFRQLGRTLQPLTAVDRARPTPTLRHDRCDISADLHDIKIIKKKKKGRLKGLSGYKWLSVRLILANKRSTVHELSSKHVNVVTLSPHRTAWRDSGAMSRVHECVRVCVSANVCLCVRACVVCVSIDIELLTRTPLPTWGADWCTRSPRTQTGRSSWPRRCNRPERRAVSFFFCTCRFCADNEKEFLVALGLTHRRGWVEWAHWWTGRQSCPAQTLLRCWAWREAPPASAPAKKKKTKKGSKCEMANLHRQFEWVLLP